MSNKAIDKVYLQRQLKNFNRDVSAQLYIAYMSALPTPAIDVESTPTYYNADQYKQYGGKIYSMDRCDYDMGFRSYRGYAYRRSIL